MGGPDIKDVFSLSIYAPEGLTERDAVPINLV